MVEAVTNFFGDLTEYITVAVSYMYQASTVIQDDVKSWFPEHIGELLSTAITIVVVLRVVRLVK